MYTERIELDKMFMDIAETVAKRSTYIRKKVGAVLVKDERIISIGYNGDFPKQKHCIDYFKELYLNKYSNSYSSFDEYIKSDVFFKEHGEYSIKNCIHAETNCLMFAAKNGISTNGCQLYVTLSPCLNCSKLLIQSGIKKIIFKELYDRDISGLSILRENNINIQKIEDIN